jgi:hypothetical protein
VCSAYLFKMIPVKTSKEMIDPDTLPTNALRWFLSSYKVIISFYITFLKFRAIIPFSTDQTLKFLFVPIYIYKLTSLYLNATISLSSVTLGS